MKKKSFINEASKESVKRKEYSIFFTFSTLAECEKFVDNLLEILAHYNLVTLNDIKELEVEVRLNSNIHDAEYYCYSDNFVGWTKETLSKDSIKIVKFNANAYNVYLPEYKQLNNKGE